MSSANPVRPTRALAVGERLALGLAKHALLPVLEAFARHPRVVRAAFGPVMRGPFGSRLGVVTRAILGATAFEAHEVDVAGGRISLGGVDEVIFSSRFLEFFHQELAASLGAEEQARTLYRVGRRGGEWEVTEALRHGRFAPPWLARLVASGELVEAARADARLGRLFDLVMGHALRFIINEGGWGDARFEMTRSPIRVTLENSQEARWLAPSKTPVCFIAAGVVAGYASQICGGELDAHEVACRASGAAACVFEIDR